MALRNRKEVDESKLRGVEIAGEASEVEFGKFTNLQNWVPAQLYSIKKKRGVEAFESDPLTPDPLTNNCGLCPSDTVPDPQSLNWEECYDIGASPSGGISSNNRGQFQVVPSPAPGLDAIAFYGSGDAVTQLDYPPETNTAQVLLLSDGGIETTVTPVPLPSGDTMKFIRTGARIGRTGHTDVLAYVIAGLDYVPSGQAEISSVVALFDWKAQTAHIMEVPFGEGYGGKWCKLGDDFYKIGGTGGNFDDLGYWDISNQYSTPVATRAEVAGSGVNLRDIYRTPNKLWAVDENSNLIELNPTTLATVNTYATGIASGIIGLHAASDTLFYICHESPSASVITIYMFELPSETLTALNIEDITSLGCQINVSSGEPEGHTFHFAGGYFYFHTSGTTGATRAGRLGPVFCPGSDDLIIGGDGES